jgi:hypothetical protein
MGVGYEATGDTVDLNLDLMDVMRSVDSSKVGSTLQKKCD